MSSPQKRVGGSIQSAIVATKTTPCPLGAIEVGSSTEFPLIRSKSPKKKASGSGGAVVSSKRHRIGIHKAVELPRVSSAISYAKQEDRPSQVPDSGEELEVLKCILVREGYLQRLKHASAQGKVSGSHLSETIDVLDLLRISTIEVIEAIVFWRLKHQRQHKVEPDSSTSSTFLWNGLNYLLKVASDIDFLEKHQGLIQWLGFTLARNPFILPVNLDARTQLDWSAEKSSSILPTGARGDDSGSHFIQVGGKRTLVDQGPEAVTAWRSAQAAALAERKRAKNPYETRVLNDEELVPVARMSSRLSSAASKRPSNGSHATVTLPSQIGELDMTRILACEHVVLKEEAIHSRYTHDTHGNLVPESEAQRRVNMVELSGGAYARRDDQSGIARNSKEQMHSTFSATEDQQGRGALSLVSPQAYAQKRAGMLGPISKPHQRKPARKAPFGRSRGAHLEETLLRERAANAQLGVLIDRAREEIERKEMDLAYFESFPGVQMFGSELEEFRIKTHSDVAVLRRDLAEKEYVFASKSANLNRKEEIIHVFKKNRQTAVEQERRSRLMRPDLPIASATDDPKGKTNQVNENRIGVGTDRHADHEQQSARKVAEKPDYQRAQARIEQPIVQDFCATLIQKIARGKLVRAAFEVLKIEYYVGSKYIQAVVRGFLARRRVAKLYWQLSASMVLQRFARGLLARRLVARRRLVRSRQRAALRIQRVLRGHFGRSRMKRVRRLFSSRQQLLQSSDDLAHSDLKELAEACLKMAAVSTDHRSTNATASRPVTSLVLCLVRVVMIFTSDRDEDVDVCGVRWKEAAHFLRCSTRLQRRVSKVAGVAATGDQYLRRSLLGHTILEMYASDSAFNELTFSSLERGWRAATGLYRWVKAFQIVYQEQNVLRSDGGLATARPFLFAEATDASEAMQERMEEQGNAIQALARERRFVPRELVHTARRRPRGILLVVGYDVPLAARNAIAGELMQALPGVFVGINRRHQHDPEHQPRVAKLRKQQIDILGADYAMVREALAVGHNVILDCDVGLTDAQQRCFLGAFTALKASLKPSPLCILLRGSLANIEVRDHADENASFRSSSRALTLKDISANRQMVDKDIKNTFEQIASWLSHLREPEMAAEMLHISSTDPSFVRDSGFVLVMEAVIILLTPNKRYEIPQRYTSGVSWKLARRLLANPPFFLGKLEATKYDSISGDNLRVLNAYVAHADWPEPTATHGASGQLLHSLASCVRSVVTCAQITFDCHGLAPSINRSTPVSGLFESVVIYRNSSTNHGHEAAAQDLLDAALADVRVYRKVHTLDSRRCVICVFHDCQRIYFSAYDPTTSCRWQRIVAEEDVDTLLAPNSVERGEDAAFARQPPTTQEQMYERLVQLCLLQPKPAAAAPSNFAGMLQPMAQHAIAALSPQHKQLIVRPPAIRLLRRVLRLGGHRVTVTLAELSRGRIQVDVTVHSLSLELRRMVSVEEILERLSNRRARDVFIPPEQLPNLVLERLHLYRFMQAARSLSETLGRTGVYSCADLQRPTPLKLGVRTKATAPGRVLLRKAIKSRWLPSTGCSPGVWLLTVLEHHSDGRFSVEVYQPHSSRKFCRSLSTREYMDLRLMELCQHANSITTPSLLRSIVKLLRFKREPDEEGESAARITGCTLRHHILARFPLGLRFVVLPHHPLEKIGVIRVYVQVETQEPERQRAVSGNVCFRVYFPDTCDEQAIVWRDVEVDSCFPTETLPWSAALRADRVKMATVMAREVLRWNPSKQRVVAELPCGSFEAKPLTTDTGRPIVVAPPAERTRSKKAMFSARSSHALLPTPSSCTTLLDFGEDEDNSDAAASDTLTDKKRGVFVYNREELIHSGSFRANGVLIAAQVFMKAEIVSCLQPRLPVDRIEQRDSFEMAFDFYHPPTSSSQRTVIRGRAKLREVVGPGKSSLISSSTIRELVEHIIEARTSVHFEPVATKTHAEAKQIRVDFVEDRLFTKHKITPLPKTLHVDAILNAAKLIDERPDRGLKLLTMAKTFTDTEGGNVILTVFDVSHTRAQHGSRGGAGVQLRVDGYVRDTSTRLSLSIEAADLVHILNEGSLDSGDSGSVDSMLLSQSVDSEELRTRRQRLARLILDHVGVERKRDGTPDRLFLLETSTSTAPSPRHQLDNGTSRRLLGKTVRLVRRVPVVLCVYAVGDNECEGLAIRCYEPHSSASAQLAVPLRQLARILGLREVDVRCSALFESLSPTTVSALISHVIKFIHIDFTHEGAEGAKPERLAMTIGEQADEDLERASQCHDQFVSCPPTTLALHRSWRGLTTTASSEHDLCALHVGLHMERANEPSADEVDVRTAQLICCVYLLRQRVVTTHVFSSDNLVARFQSPIRPANDFLQACAKHISVLVHSPTAQEQGDTSATKAHSPRGRLLPDAQVTIGWSH